MYRTIRKIHLYSAFVVLAFLLMYFITGAVIIMEDVFPRKTAPEIKIISIDSFDLSKPIHEQICERYNIRGTQVSKEWHKAYVKPGYRAEIKFIEGKKVQLKIDRGSFGRTMSDFHRLRGYTGHWTHIVWALLYDLSCMALLVFAFTGLYLWCRLERKKTAGFLLLMLSTGLTVFTIVYIFWVC